MFVLAGAVTGLVAAVFGSDDVTNCVPLARGSAGTIRVAGYDAEQLDNAATIAVGKHPRIGHRVR